MNRVVGYREVLVEKLRGVGVVRMDASHTGGGNDHHLGFFLRVEVTDGHGIAEIELLAGPEQEVVVTTCKKRPDDG